MSKIIPFYGKEDTLKSYKEIGDSYFELYIYDINGDVKTSKLITSKEQMLKKYVDAIDGYLFYMKDKYKVANELLESGVIKRNCLIIFIVSVLVGVGVPAVGYFTNSLLTYYLGFVITALLCVPAFIYSLKELVLKESERDIKKSINKYDSLKEERDYISKKIEEKYLNQDKTSFNSIKPMKREVKNEDKKLVKKRE